MKRKHLFKIFCVVLALPFCAWGQELSQVVPADTFSTPHFRIMYERGISIENIRAVADDIELIFGDFNAKVMLRLPKEIPTVLGASFVGLMRRISGRIESPAFYSHDTLYIVSWNDAGIARERMLPILRFAIAYSILDRGSVHGTPRWLTYGYALRYANIELPLTPPPVAYMRSFDDFTEEGQQSNNPKEIGDYNYLLLKTLDFLINRYGEQKFISLFMAIPSDKTLEEGFEKTFGEKYRDIEKAWRVYIDTQVGKSVPRKGDEPKHQEK